MPGRKQKQVTLAMEFIREQIRCGLLDEEHYRLPSIRRLAALSGISFVTMWKAVRMLHTQGAIYKIPGERGFSSRPSIESPSATVPVSLQPRSVPRFAWERVRSEIEGSITLGHFLPGKALPTAKELSSQYRADRRTVAKALMACAEKKHLIHLGRGYAVPLPTHDRQKLKIASLSLFPDHGQALLGHQGIQYLGLLEHECASLLVTLTAKFYRPSGDTVSFVDSSGNPTSEIEHDDQIAGFVFIVTVQDSVHAKAIRKVSLARKPIAVLDAIGGWRVPSTGLGDVLLKTFPMAAQKGPGETVGRHLLELGHRRVAYLSMFHYSFWSQQRLRGLFQIFYNAGISDSVIPFTTEAYTSYDQFLGKTLEAQGMQQLLSEMKRLCESRLSVLPSSLGPRLFDGVSGVLRDALFWEEVFGHMKKLFDNALADTNITAWITSEDVVGVMALHYLRMRGIEIPRRISVISFDNSAAAFVNELTSYDFNAPAILRAMVNFILHPLWLTGKDRRNATVEINGFVVSRATSGPPASR